MNPRLKNFLTYQKWLQKPDDYQTIEYQDHKN